MKKINDAKFLLENYWEGYNNRDLNFLLNLFSDKVTLWGTGVDEFRQGKKELEIQLQRDWSQCEESKVEIISIVENSENNTWIAADCRALITINDKKYVFDNLRLTLIIEKEESNWRIIHIHASFPDFRNAENNSFPTLKAE